MIRGGLWIWIGSAALLACGSGTDLFEAVGGGTASATSATGAPGGAGGAASTGGAAACAPGETESCYSGPAGTRGVGACMPGQRTCEPDGMGFGPCEGEVVPSFDDCSTTADEDCDGDVVACSGAHLWSRRFDGG